MNAVQIDTGSKRLHKSSAGVAKGEKGEEKKKKACLFEPVQVVCLESGEAHVVAAGAAIAGRAGRAGNAYFVGGFSDPVTPEREAIQLRYKHATECSLSTYRISNT